MTESVCVCVCVELKWDNTEITLGRCECSVGFMFLNCFGGHGGHASSQKALSSHCFPHRVSVEMPIRAEKARFHEILSLFHPELEVLYVCVCVCVVSHPNAVVFFGEFVPIWRNIHISMSA